MPLYAVIGLDHEPHAMALRDSVRTEHRQYYLDNAIGVRLAGAFYQEQNQCGTLLIVEAGSEGEIRDWLAQEPFCRAGVYRDLRILEWRQAFNSLEQSGWPDVSSALARGQPQR